MLSKGSDLVNNQKHDEAIIIFTKVIDLDPDWAEAWNKRATGLYLIGGMLHDWQSFYPGAYFGIP